MWEQWVLLIAVLSLQPSIIFSFIIVYVLIVI